MLQMYLKNSVEALEMYQKAKYMHQRNEEMI